MRIKKKMGSLAKENQTPRFRIRDVIGQLQNHARSFRFSSSMYLHMYRCTFAFEGVHCHLC